MFRHRRITIVNIALAIAALASGCVDIVQPGEVTIAPPTQGETQVSVRIDLPADAEVNGEWALVAGVHEAALSGGEGKANVNGDGAQLVTALFDAAPAMMAVSLGDGQRLILNPFSTGIALVFLSPELVTSHRDSASRVVNAVTRAASFGALTSYLTGRLESGELSLLTPDPQLAVLIRAVTSEATAAISAQSPGGNDPLFDPTPGTQQRSGVTVTVQPKPDGAFDLNISNSFKRAVTVVYATSHNGSDYSSLPAVNGSPWSPANMLFGSGIFSTDPTKSVHVPSATPYSRVKAYGMGLSDLGEAWSELRVDPDGWFAAWPILFSGVVDLGVPLYEVLTGVQGLGELPIWGGQADPGRKWVQAAMKECGFNATEPNPAVWIERLGDLVKEDYLSAGWNLAKCAAVPLLDADIIVPLMVAHGAAVTGSLLANLIVPLRVAFLLKNAADLIQGGYALRTARLVEVFDFVDPDFISGSVRIVTTSTGEDLDSDGYLYAIDGGVATRIGVNSTASQPGLSPGAHYVTLSNIASNCSLSGTNPRWVTVTGGDALDARFELECVRKVTNQAPVATIHAPPNGAMFSLGQPVTFTGSGTDPEDGELTGTSLRWTSHIDGFLGLGPSLTTNELSVNTHVITLVVTDSEGLTGSSQRTIVIAKNQRPSTTIIKPVDGATFFAGESIVFEGAGFDPEDGPLPGTALSWSSSLDGVFGTGSQVVSNAMRVGRHVITLEAHDSQKANGTSSITIDIIASAPDLRVEFVEVIPSNPTVGDPISIRTAIKNIGSGSSAPSSVRISTGAIDENGPIKSLSAGQADTVLLTVQNTLVPGLHQGTAYADWLNQIPNESNENNNSLAFSFTVSDRIGIAGGTLTDRLGAVQGSAFLVDPNLVTTTLSSLTIAGPPGWNGGAAFPCTLWRPPGAAPNRRLCWLNSPALTGDYTATAHVNDQLVRGVTSINAGNSLGAPSVNLASATTSTASVAWTAPLGARSFLVRIDDSPYTRTIKDTVVSGEARHVTLTGLSLTSGGTYTVWVFAASSDMVTPGELVEPFNMTSDYAGVTAESSLSVAGGTIRPRTEGGVGTVFAFNPETPFGTITDGVTIRGPEGWNSGQPFRCLPGAPRGQAPTRLICWTFDAPPVTGQYTADAVANGAPLTARFSIDAQDQLGAHLISNVAPSTVRTTVTWIDQNGVGSFEVRVEELGGSTEIVDSEVVPGSLRQHTLNGLSLRSGTQYRAVVLSHSHDVFTPMDLGAQFNMAFDVWLFTIGGSSPNSLGVRRGQEAPPVAHRVP